MSVSVCVVFWAPSFEGLSIMLLQSQIPSRSLLLPSQSPLGPANVVLFWASFFWGRRSGIEPKMELHLKAQARTAQARSSFLPSVGAVCVGAQKTTYT